MDTAAFHILDKKIDEMIEMFREQFKELKERMDTNQSSCKLICQSSIKNEGDRITRVERDLVMLNEKINVNTKSIAQLRDNYLYISGGAGVISAIVVWIAGHY